MMLGLVAIVPVERLCNYSSLKEELVHPVDLVLKKFMQIKGIG